jgi:hypothetical protein
MQLYTKCHHCQQELSLPFAHPDKSELIKEKGDSLHLRCHHCHQQDKYEWYEIHAREEKRMLLIVLGFLLIPSLVFGILFREEIFLSMIWYNVLAVCLLVLVPCLLYLELRAQEHLDTRLFDHS